jgi:hypothetical protein
MPMRELACSRPWAQPIIPWLYEQEADEPKLDEWREYMPEGINTILTTWHRSKPVIVAMHGYHLGWRL